MEKRIKASARVQVTIEVHEAAWGGDCSIEQLYKQAAEGGVSKLRNILLKAECPHTIIGEPKVIGVLTEAT